MRDAVRHGTFSARLDCHYLVHEPDVAEAGRCFICARPLCLSCAIAFRGRVLGPECLATVLDDAPRQPPPVAPRYPKSDLLVLIGLGLILVLTVFPWTRFGDHSGPVDAWRIQWSLLASVSALLGLAFAIKSRLRPGDPSVEAAVVATLAFLAGLSDGLDWLSFGGLETLLSYGVPLRSLPRSEEAVRAMNEVGPSTGEVEYTLQS